MSVGGAHAILNLEYTWQLFGPRLDDEMMLKQNILPFICDCMLIPERDDVASLVANRDPD